MKNWEILPTLTIPFVNERHHCLINNTQSNIVMWGMQLYLSTSMLPLTLYYFDDQFLLLYDAHNKFNKPY